jgi:hypothetical protein
VRAGSPSARPAHGPRRAGRRGPRPSPPKLSYFAAMRWRRPQDEESLSTLPGPPDRGDAAAVHHRRPHRAVFLDQSSEALRGAAYRSEAGQRNSALSPAADHPVPEVPSGISSRSAWRLSARAQSFD